MMATDDAQLREHVLELLTRLEQPDASDATRRALSELLWADAMQPIDLGSGHAQQLATPPTRDPFAYFLVRSEREEMLAWLERARVLPEVWRRVAGLRPAQAMTLQGDMAARVAACGVGGVEPAQRKAWLGRLGVAGARAAAETLARVPATGSPQPGCMAWCRAMVDQVCEQGTGERAMERLGRRTLRALALHLTPEQDRAFEQLARTRGMLGESENPPAKIPPEIHAVLISWVSASLEELVARKG